MAEFLPDASEEMIAAAEWYEAQRTDTGARFLSDVARYLELSGAQPGAHAVLSYRIVYRSTPDTVVVAVAHSSRRPGYWMKQLHGV